jgi:hypothetical protein
MSALEFIEDLWSPPEPPNAPPKRQFVAGTLGGVRNAVWDFARLYLYEGPQREAVKKAVAARLEAREGARMTFLSEFLYLGDQIEEGLIIGVVGKGGHVASLYHSMRGMRAVSLTREAARELFAKGTMAVSIDESGRRAVTAIGWHVEKPLTLANAPAVDASAPAPPPPAAREARGAGQLLQWRQAAEEDEKRVAHVRSVILNGRWGSPPR